MNSYTKLISPFDRGFSSFFNNLFTVPNFDWNQPFPEVQFRCTDPKFPLTNAFLDKETKDINLSLALAGYKKRELSVKVEGTMLVISGKKEKSEEELKTMKEVLHEIKFKDFEAKYKVPEGKYELGKLDVSFEDGLLNINIPAKESEKPKEVEIR